ncbi:homocitrate synthase/isopropylmalate synthase family protein [Lacrimispora sp.]|uniref:homocitrate synthase/isopropylmalate synthase family protein n=1 Tax=Lacrimispora sp. TaxID=2719234 RepID=UPI002FD8AF11
MVRIIDATLTMLDDYMVTAAQAQRFLELLLEIGIDGAAVSPEIYRLLGGKMPERMTGYLELPGMPAECKEYPGIQYIISTYCSGIGRCIQNHQINELAELKGIPTEDPTKRFRLTGLDDLLTYESERIYDRAMEELVKIAPILYPENAYYCATAIAVSYLQRFNGGTVMTTFTGIGSKAATEQVIAAMRVMQRHKPNQDLTGLKKLRQLFEEMTGIAVDDHAPVIGERIFYVESGIHVDGVLKKPSNYESYPPEMVGACREIILGKHSGKASVRYKLNALGLDEAEYDKARILGQVKRLSIKKGKDVTDQEFLEIAGRCRNNA